MTAGVEAMNEDTLIDLMRQLHQQTIREIDRGFVALTERMARLEREVASLMESSGRHEVQIVTLEKGKPKVEHGNGERAAITRRDVTIVAAVVIAFVAVIKYGIEFVRWVIESAKP
jgi:hypothetical protein